MDPVAALGMVMQLGYASPIMISRLLCVTKRLSVTMVTLRSLKLDRVESRRLYMHRNEPFAALLLARYVHTLDLSRTYTRDVSALGNVHTLNIRHTFVADVSALGGVHTLDLRDTLVEDVLALSDVNTLYLDTFTRKKWPPTPWSPPSINSLASSAGSKSHEYASCP